MDRWMDLYNYYSSYSSQVICIIGSIQYYHCYYQLSIFSRPSAKTNFADLDSCGDQWNTKPLCRNSRPGSPNIVVYLTPTTSDISWCVGRGTRTSGRVGLWICWLPIPPISKPLFEGTPQFTRSTRHSNGKALFWIKFITFQRKNDPQGIKNTKDFGGRWRSIFGGFLSHERSQSRHRLVQC